MGPGKRLGADGVVAPTGTGGMGEAYRAQPEPEWP